MDAVADWASFIKDFFDDTKNGVSTLASGLSETTGGLTQRFPFSIPWDILIIMESLAETPQTPKFEFLIQIERYGIDEKLVIDFTDLKPISTVSRTLLTISYILALMNLTERLVQVKKGD